MDFEDFTPLTAAGGGHSRADWGNWAKRQLRDQNGDDAGEWIEMGRGSRFRYQKSDGSIGTGTATYVGFSNIPNHGRFYIKGVDGIKEGVYELDAGAVDPVKFYFAEGTKVGDYLENYYKSIGRNLDDLDVPSKLPVIDFSKLTPSQLTQEEANEMATENRMPPPANLDEQLKSRTESAKTASELREGDIVFDETLKRYGSVEVAEPSPDGSGNIDIVVRWSNNQVQELTNLPADQEVKVWPAQEELAVDEKKRAAKTKAVDDIKVGDRVTRDGKNYTISGIRELQAGVQFTAKPDDGGPDKKFSVRDGEKLNLAPEAVAEQPVEEAPVSPAGQAPATEEAKTKKAAELKKGDRILINGEPHLVSEVAKDGEGVVLQVSPEDGQGSFEQEFVIDQLVDLAPKKTKTTATQKAEEEATVSGSKELYDNVLKNGGATYIYRLKPGDVLIAANGQEYLFISSKALDSKDGKQPHNITVQGPDGAIQTFTTAGNKVKTKQEPLPKKDKNFAEFDLRQLRVVNKKSQLKAKTEDQGGVTDEEDGSSDEEVSKKEVGELRPAEIRTVNGESVYLFRDFVFIDGKGYGVIDIIEEEDGSGVKLELQTISEDVNVESEEFILDKLYQYSDIVDLANESGKAIKPKKARKSGTSETSRVTRATSFSEDEDYGPGATGVLVDDKEHSVSFVVLNSGKKIFIRGVDKKTKFNQVRVLRYERIKQAVAKFPESQGVFKFYFNNGTLTNEGAPTKRDKVTPSTGWVIELEPGTSSDDAKAVKNLIKSLYEELAKPEPKKDAGSAEAGGLEFSGEPNTTGSLAPLLKFTIDSDGVIELAGRVDLENGYEDLEAVINNAFPDGNVVFDLDAQTITVYSDGETTESDLRARVLTEIKKALGGAPAGSTTDQGKDGQGGGEPSSNQRYYDIYKAANEFFASSLESPEAAEYIKNRGISIETAKKAGIVFAPQSNNSLYKHLVSLGFTPQEILSSGLGMQNLDEPDKPTVRDVFNRRLLFPFTDPEGRVIGYSGRSTNPDPKKVKSFGKYKVTTNNEVYGKSKTLYNLSNTKESVKSTGQLIVVEGQFDVLAMIEAGRENVIATSTAGISKEQIELLKSFYGDDLKEIVIVYDTDNAGKIGSENVGAVLKEAGYQVYTATIPQPADAESPLDVSDLYKAGRQDAIDELILSKSKFGGPSKSQIDEITALLVENPEVFSEAYIKNFFSILENYSEKSADTLIKNLQKQVDDYKKSLEEKDLEVLLQELKDLIEKAVDAGAIIRVQGDKLLNKIEKSENKAELIKDSIKTLTEKLAPKKAEITPGQRKSIERRFKGTFVTQAQRDALVAILSKPDLSESDISGVIKTLDLAEVIWRMNNGWALEELRGITMDEPLINLGLTPQQVLEKMKTYKPTKDANGNPLQQESTPKEKLEALIKELIKEAYSGTDGESRDYAISMAITKIDSLDIKDYSGLTDYINKDSNKGPAEIEKKIELWAKFEKELLRSRTWEADAEKAKETPIEDKDISNAISQILDTIPDWAPNQSNSSLARILLQGTYNKVLETEEDLQGYYSVASRLSEKILDILGSRLVKNALDKFNSSNKDEKAVEKILLDLNKSMQNLKITLLRVIMLDTPKATGSERNLGDNYTRAAVGLQQSTNDILNGKIAYAKKTIKKSSDSSGSGSSDLTAESTEQKPEFFDPSTNILTPEKNNNAYWTWAENAIKNGTISPEDLNELKERIRKNAVTSRIAAQGKDANGNPAKLNVLKSNVLNYLKKNPDATPEDVKSHLDEDTSLDKSLLKWTELVQDPKLRDEIISEIDGLIKKYYDEAKAARPATTPTDDLGRRTGTNVLPQTMDNNNSDGSRAYAPGGAIRGKTLQREIAEADRRNGVQGIQEYLDNQNVVGLDTETSGMENYDGQLRPGNRLIQIGASRIDKEGKEERFNIYVNPENGVVMSQWSKDNLMREVLDENGNPTGEFVKLDSDWLGEQPSEKEALEKLIEFIGKDAILVAHNLNFDVSVIAEALERHGLSIDAKGAIDTMGMVDYALPTYNPKGKNSKGATVPVELDGPKRLASGIKPSEANPNNPEHFQASRTLKDSLKYFGLSTSGHHRADADAYDALMVLQKVLGWLIENPEKESTNAIGHRFLDFEKIDKSNERTLAKYMQAIGSGTPATNKQKNPEAKDGFAEDLRANDISEKEIMEIMQPIAKMTRGQAGNYIASIFEDIRAGKKPDTTKAMANSGFAGTQGGSNTIPVAAEGEQDTELEEISKLAEDLLPGDRVRLEGDETYGTVKSVEKLTPGYVSVSILYDNGDEEEILIPSKNPVAVYRKRDPKDESAADSSSAEASESESGTPDNSPTTTIPAVTPVIPATTPTTEVTPTTPPVKTFDLSDYPAESRETLKKFMEALNGIRVAQDKDEIPVIESGRPAGLVDRNPAEYIGRYYTKEEMYQTLLEMGVPKLKAKVMATKLHFLKGKDGYKKELDKVNEYLEKLEQSKKDFNRLEEQVTFYEFLRRSGINDEIGFVLGGEKPERVVDRQMARQLFWAWRESVLKRNRTKKTLKDGNITVSYAADEEKDAKRLLEEAKKLRDLNPIDGRKVDIKILDPEQLVLLGLGDIKGASLVNEDNAQIAISSATLGKKDSDGVREDTMTLSHEYGHVYEEISLDGESREDFAKEFSPEGGASEKFADLFAESAYSKIYKKKLPSPVVKDFNKFIKKVQSKEKVTLKKEGPFFSEIGPRPKEAHAKIDGSEVEGVIERTGKSLEDFEASMNTGNGGLGSWLKGTDAEAGYLPDLSNPEVAIKYVGIVSPLTKDEALALGQKEQTALLDRVRDLLNPIIEAQRQDKRRYRVLSIPGTNVHIRFKNGGVDAATLSGVVEELKSLHTFSDMDGMPVVVTLAEPNTFSIYGQFQGDTTEFGGTSNKEGFNVFNYDKTSMHVVLGLHNAKTKYVPDERDKFKAASPETVMLNALIHEYLGHGIAKIFLGQHYYKENVHHERFKDFENKFPLDTTSNHPVSWYANASTGESFAEYIRAGYLLLRSGISAKGTYPEIAKFLSYVEPIITEVDALVQTSPIGQNLIITDNKNSQVHKFQRGGNLSTQIASVDIFNDRDYYYSNGLDPYGRKAGEAFSADLQSLYKKVLKARNAYYTSGSNEDFTKFAAFAATLNELYNSKYFNYAKANPSKNAESVLEKITTNDGASTMRRWQSDKPFVSLRYPSTAKKFNNSFTSASYTSKNGDIYQVVYVSSSPADASDSESESAHVFVSKPNQDLSEFVGFDTTFNDLMKTSSGHMAIRNIAERGTVRSSDDLEIQGTYVGASYRRKGLATAMLAFARQNNRKNLRFSKQQTIQEDSWARSVDQVEENHMGKPAFLDENGDLGAQEVSPISHLSVRYRNTDPASDESPRINYNSASRNSDTEDSSTFLSDVYLQNPVFTGLGRYSSSTGGGLGPNQSVIGAVNTELLSTMAGNTVDENRVLEIMEKIKSGEGFIDPVIVYYDEESKNMVVADGNHHVEAAKRLGISHVPTRVMVGKFDPQEYLSVIPARNQSSVSPFTSEQWPQHVNPYFIFRLEDLVSSDNKGPAVDELSRDIVVKTGGQVFSVADDIAKAMGRIVLDNETGQIWQVIDEYYENMQPTGKVVVRRLVGQGDSLAIVRQTVRKGESYDLSDGKKAYVRLGNQALNEEYNDFRQYVLEARDLTSLQDVTESFIQSGGQGRIYTESMYYQYNQDSSITGRINRYVSPGEVELLQLVSVENGEKRYTTHVVPIRDLQIIDDQREGLGARPILQSSDMKADYLIKTDLSLVITTLAAKGAISVDFANILRKTFASESQTRSGAEDMLDSLLALNHRVDRVTEKYRAQKAAEAAEAAKAAKPAKGTPAVAEPVETRPVAKSRPGRMSFTELYNQAIKKQKEAGEIPVDSKESGSSFSENPVSKPDSADLEEIKNILVELTNVPEFGYSKEEAEKIIASLDGANVSAVQEYLDVLARQRLQKRIKSNEPIAGLRIPSDLPQEILKRLEEYSKNGQSGVSSEVKLKTVLNKEQAETVNEIVNNLKPGETFLVSGQAGTGKSVTLKATVSELKARNRKFMVVAPTSPAASNLGSEVGAQTIHRAFGLPPNIVVGPSFITEVEDYDENGNKIIIPTSSVRKFAEMFATKNGKKIAELAKLEFLIIDEISMVDSHMIDLLNLALSVAKNNFSLPFGGVKIVPFGDDRQLPPVEKMSQEKYIKSLEDLEAELEGRVIKPKEFEDRKRALDLEFNHGQFMAKNYKSYRWFNANIFASYPIAMTELTENVRQAGDPEFALMNTRLSRGKHTQGDIDKLNTQVGPWDGKSIVLTYRNQEADDINDFNIEKLKNSGAQGMEFSGVFEGNRFAFRDDDLLVKPSTTYYVGQRVMFTVNDIKDLQDQVGYSGAKRFDNGTLGTIVGFSEENLPIVEIEKEVKNPVTGEMELQKNEVVVGKKTEEKYGSKIVTIVDPISGRPEQKIATNLEATYSQIPLKPGYAVTTHKAQGRSLEKAHLLIGTKDKPVKSFSPGQSSVAVSRLTSLKGLTMSRPFTMDDFFVDPEVQKFYEELDNASIKAAERKVKERQQQQSAQAQPSSPTPSAPAVDEKTSGADKMFAKNPTRKDLNKAKDIINYRTKAIPSMPADWGTTDLSDYFFSQFGYGEEDSFKQNLNAIVSEKLENLHLEQKLLVSLIAAHGKADIYTHAETGTTIKRHLKGGLFNNKDASDNEVLLATAAHKRILDSGLVIDGGRMDINLRDLSYIGEPASGLYSASKDEINIDTSQVYGWKLQDDKNKMSEGDQFAYVVAHEYGHALDNKLGENGERLSVVLENLIKSGMQNRAKEILRMYALTISPEYFAESYAGLVLQSVLNKLGYSDKTIMDETLMDEVKNRINSRNSQQ